MEGIPISQQHIIWSGEELKDGSILHESGIRNLSKLRLVVSMRGGPVNTRWLYNCVYYIRTIWRIIYRTLTFLKIIHKSPVFQENFDRCRQKMVFIMFQPKIATYRKSCLCIEFYHYVTRRESDQWNHRIIDNRVMWFDSVFSCDVMIKFDA